MNRCKNFVDSIKNADFTGIFRLIMKEPSYVMSREHIEGREKFMRLLYVMSREHIEGREKFMRLLYVMSGEHNGGERNS